MYIYYSFIICSMIMFMGSESSPPIPGNNPCDDNCEPQELCDKLCSIDENSEIDHADAKRAIFLRLGRQFRRASFLGLGAQHLKKSKFLRLGK